MTTENQLHISQNTTLAPITTNDKCLDLKSLNKEENLMENKCDIVGPFWSVDKPLDQRSVKLLTSLVPNFNAERLERLIVFRSLKTLGISKDFTLTPTLNSEVNSISLRCLEWLVTNYAKKWDVMLYNSTDKKRFSIYKEYESQLSNYRRIRFDPFCRHKRIYFTWELEDAKTREKRKVVLPTTVGQLNFMDWADNNGVLDYANLYQENIKKDMETTLSEVNKEKRKFKKMGKKRKRKELSKAPETFCTVYSIDTMLYFDHQFDDSEED